MTTRIWIATALMGLAACSTPQTSMVEIRDQPEEALLLARFPGAGKLLSGFDVPREDSATGAGERILFGLELDNAGKKKRWLMLAEVESTPGSWDKSRIDNVKTLTRQTFRTPSGQKFSYESRRWPIKVSLYDAHGKQLGSSTVVVPWDFLKDGFIRACDLTQRLVLLRKGPIVYRGKEFTNRQAAREIYGGFAALSAFLQLVQENDLLAKVFWQVIDRPSMFSVVLQGGVHLYIRSNLSAAGSGGDGENGKNGEKSKNGEESRDGEESEGDQKEVPVMIAPSYLRNYKVPLQVKANDTPVLNATMRVTDPWTPFRACGGILSLTGFRPSDPNVRFRMEVLAARRISR